MRAFSNLRSAPHYRADAFAAGLRAIGAHFHGLPRGSFQPGDLLLSWNRYGGFDAQCRAAAAAGAHVLVIENGIMGRDAPGGPWYSIARDNTALVGGNYDGRPFEPGARIAMGARPVAKIGEWRHDGREVIVLAQRGIGPPDLAQPRGWEQRAAQWFSARQPRPVRIRMHPGEGPCIALEEDLANAAYCVTWASGAGVKALAMGIPVVFKLPSWIARPIGTWWDSTSDCFPDAEEPPSEFERRRHFAKMGWSTWNTEEIATGFPLRRLLSPSTESGTTTAAG